MLLHELAHHARRDPLTNALLVLRRRGALVQPAGAVGAGALPRGAGAGVRRAGDGAVALAATRTTHATVRRDARRRRRGGGVRAGGVAGRRDVRQQQLRPPRAGGRGGDDSHPVSTPTEDRDDRHVHAPRCRRGSAAAPRRCRRCWCFGLASCAPDRTARRSRVKAVVDVRRRPPAPQPPAAPTDVARLADAGRTHQAGRRRRRRRHREERAVQAQLDRKLPEVKFDGVAVHRRRRLPPRRQRRQHLRQLARPRDRRHRPQRAGHRPPAQRQVLQGAADHPRRRRRRGRAARLHDRRRRHHHLHRRRPRPQHAHPRLRHPRPDHRHPRLHRRPRLQPPEPAGRSGRRRRRRRRAGAVRRVRRQRPRPEEDEGRTREELIEEITTLIPETVAPDSWRDNGGTVGSIRELQGQLIVTQTPENQRQLVNLLEQLRETRAIQVTVEARFLTLDPAALAEPLRQKLGPSVQGKDRPGATFLTDEDVKRAAPAPARRRRPRRHRPADHAVQRPAGVRHGRHAAGVRLRLHRHEAGAAERPSGSRRSRSSSAGVRLDVMAARSQDRKYATLTLRPNSPSSAAMRDELFHGSPDAP